MVDVILCPAGPGAAPLLNCSRYWGYTSQWNLLDYPALVFPVTKVDPNIDVWDTRYVAMNDQDQYNHSLCKLLLCPLSGGTSGFAAHSVIDREPQKYREAPVSLQLVGRRYDDEKVRCLQIGCEEERHVDDGVDRGGFRVHEGTNRSSFCKLHLAFPRCATAIEQIHHFSLYYLP